MKAFEFNYNQFTYPTEMDKIITYLKSVGKINVSFARLEQLYFDFSEDRYCAQWMYVDNDLLEEFAGWLSRQEV